jgi:hypothetical protein
MLAKMQGKKEPLYTAALRATNAISFLVQDKIYILVEM